MADELFLRIHSGEIRHNTKQCLNKKYKIYLSLRYISLLTHKIQ